MADGGRWTLAWRERPSEEAALFNPAFCGELLARTIKAYSRSRGLPLPLPFAFVMLPLILHPATRRDLPSRANTTFVSWSAKHESILVELPKRVLRLRPVTREALLFLYQLRVVKIDMKEPLAELAASRDRNNSKHILE